MKRQSIGNVHFLFFCGIELNPALQIIDQSSEVKVSHIFARTSEDCN